MLGKLAKVVTFTTALGLGLSGQALAGEKAGLVKNFQQYAIENPGEIKGAKLKDGAGMPLGEIQNIVRAENSSDIYLIVKTDGYTDSTRSLTAVNARDVRWRGDRAILASKGTNLPLAISRYAHEELKTFEYVGNPEIAVAGNTAAH